MAPDESQPAPDVTATSPEPRPRPALAWQPFTPRGVAAYAGAPAAFLFAVQFLMAVAAVVIVLWFLATAWFPVMGAAVQALPEAGALRAGQLTSPFDSAEPLAMNRFLAVMLDPVRDVSTSVGADLVVELHAREFRIRSLFGWMVSGYPPQWDIDLGRTAMLARWEAWKPHLLWMAAIGTVAWLMINWTVLATLYSPVVKFVVFFKEREASLAACWRLAGAALMPGALLANAALVLYGLGALGLIELLVVAVLHLMVGWVYLVLPLSHLPFRGAARGRSQNPFAPEPISPVENEPTESEEDAAPPRRNPNPFA